MLLYVEGNMLSILNSVKKFRLLTNPPWDSNIKLVQNSGKPHSNELHYMSYMLPVYILDPFLILLVAIIGVL